MDDGSTAKAPVTRLRRRLSVEAEEVKSPSGVTTPTKKRGGRLAAKPQLDLIDENATEIPSKRTTRKTAAKAVAEPAEEMTLTPSKRIARIKSNTSITSETTSYDSPRAKRAARRSSLAGSDNETSTPARQTKRTRKDSTSSIDKQVDSTSILKTPNISKAIIEEETNNDDTEKKSFTRRSPRFREQKEKENILEETAINISEIKTNIQSDEPNENPITNKQTESTFTEIPIISNEMNIKDKEKAADNNSSVDLLIDLNKKAQKLKSLKNKSCTDIDSSNIFHYKRNRTKSWTSISAEPSNNDIFFSDNEVSKKKRKNKISPLNNTGPEDSGAFIKTNESNNKSIDRLKENTTTISLKEKSFTGDSIIGTKDESSKNIEDSNPTSELFKNAPSIHVRSVVFTDEDSDSNTDIGSNHKQSKLQDQCVPIVHDIHDRDNLKSNISYEPMDIDDTLTENVSIKNFHENNTATVSKSSICIEESAMTIKNNSKSTIETYSESQDLEKSNNENKSTLILSQIKDTSSNEMKAATPTTCSKNNEQLSKSVGVSDISMNKKSNKVNLSLNYLTSTPLQQKISTKLDVQLDSPLISPKHVYNEQIDNKTSPNNDHISDTDSNELIHNNKEKSLVTKSKDSSGHSTSEEESESDTSRKQNSMIDDEVEQASDNYESGDSQNEEDREYERNNEILEKGETLSSEDFSDDSEYEKDSFVVSSAEEDYELLSGSGDNLSMSDNELNMSAKSKMKYNKRKLKEQKKASREMYNARHKLNESQGSDVIPKTKKIKRQRLDSSALISDDEKIKEHGDNKKIDENNVTECCLDDISIKKKKKVTPLIDSMCNEEPEKEITILNDSKNNKVDPLLVQVKEENQSPHKSLNVTTVLINDAVEEVNVNENVSMSKLSASLDPLQTTTNIDEEYSSNSENEEIVENYNSILKDLNKNTKKIKSFDISLNKDKKKKITKEPIIDELNITLTKTKKKKQIVLDDANSAELLQSNCSNETDNSKVNNDDDKASDSIDMRLLFPEDSNDSEHSCGKSHGNNKITKKIEEKANIRTSAGNESADTFPFFIDTQGTRDDDSSDEISSNQSPKKSKNKPKSSNLLSNDDEIESSSLEIINTSEIKKKNKSLSHSNTSIPEDLAEKYAENYIKSSEKKTKKAKLSFSTSIDEPSTQIDSKDFVDARKDTKEEVTHSDKKKNKHSKKHTDYVDIQTAETATPEEGLPGLTSSSKKKKKAKQSLDTSSAGLVETDLLEFDEGPEEVLYQSNKKKKHSIDDIQSNLEFENTHLENTAPKESSGKKKKKTKASSPDSFNKSSTDTDNQDKLDIEVAPDEVLNPKSKRKQSAENIESEIIYSEIAAPEESHANISSGKKKKKKSKTSQDTFNKSSTDTDNKQVELDIDDASDELLNRKNKKKQFSQNLQSNVEVETMMYSEETVPEESLANISSGKKKKKSKTLQDSFNKSSTNADDLNTEGEPVVETSVEIHKKKKNVTKSPENLEVNSGEDVDTKALSSKKRKREHIHEFISVESSQMSENTSNLLLGNERKKRKILQDNENTGKTDKKYKKRKERDDEGTSKVSKVFKQNSADKVYVQRLPSDILSKLEDKPRKDTTEKKMSRVISTTEFIVEDQHKIKRNKPSNYLEDSVYINDTPILKKDKKIIKKPKVLPFIPTASTSEEGFTTNFRINLLPGDNQFTAQSTNVTDFRSDVLRANKLKKFRTFEKYTSQRKYKISKF